MKKILSFFLALGFYLNAHAQPDSCSLQISLLTCAPGEELYSTFGHSAMRVKDVQTGMDVIYNYGTFEFSPQFYTEFIQGKLLYYLSVQEFNDFVAAYRWEKRSIVEQVLQLDCADKQKLFEALQVNSLDSNKYYRYDFLFDNCSSRLRDILSKGIGKPVAFGNILGNSAPTFRDLIHTYLDRGGQYWSQMGIDLLLGSRMDRTSTSEQSMFLPDYLLKGYDNASIDGRKLAMPVQPVLEIESPLNKGSWFRPSVVFSVLLLVMIVLSLTGSPRTRSILTAMDKSIFLLAGLSGLLMLFMWFGTDHALCADNFNLIWALPTHVIVAWVMHRERQWIRLYFSIVFVSLVLFLSLWALIPQEINTSLLPFIGLLCWRSLYFSNFRKYVLRKPRTPQQ